jgi:hypothetical protein
MYVYTLEHTEYKNGQINIKFIRIEKQSHCDMNKFSSSMLGDYEALVLSMSML